MFPALALNYLGQSALVIQTPSAVADPFFLMGPSLALHGFVVLATIATVIASQAVITAAFSMTRQAIQLGLLPRLVSRHTSATETGPIFLPAIWDGDADNTIGVLMTRDILMPVLMNAPFDRRSLQR